MRRRAPIVSLAPWILAKNAFRATVWALATRLSAGQRAEGGGSRVHGLFQHLSIPKDARYPSSILGLSKHLFARPSAEVEVVQAPLTRDSSPCQLPRSGSGSSSSSMPRFGWPGSRAPRRQHAARPNSEAPVNAVTTGSRVPPTQRWRRSEKKAGPK
ncbi:hypothetical protein JHW43_007227 [Diplocarpon mali]|nr:hypothetical protein JHW43_007227 [Diplocarpon mali]